MLIVVGGGGWGILDKFCLFASEKKRCILFNVLRALHIQVWQSLGVVACNSPQVQGMCPCSLAFDKVPVVQSVCISSYSIFVDFQLDI